MKRIVEKNLVGYRILFLYILSFALYLFMLTVTIPEVMYSSGGMKILDMMPKGYNPEYVNSLLNALGERGRHAYLFHQLPVDMIYPLLFGVSNCLLLAWLLNQIGKLNGNLFYLSLLPLLAGLFDYFENVGIIIMLNTFPHISVLISKVTNIFTISKSFCTTFYFCVLIIILIVFAKKRIFPPGS